MHLPTHTACTCHTWHAQAGHTTGVDPDTGPADVARGTRGRRAGQTHTHTPLITGRVARRPTRVATIPKVCSALCVRRSHNKSNPDDVLASSDEHGATWCGWVGRENAGETVSTHTLQQTRECGSQSWCNNEQLFAMLCKCSEAMQSICIGDGASSGSCGARLAWVCVGFSRFHRSL